MIEEKTQTNRKTYNLLKRQNPTGMVLRLPTLRPPVGVAREQVFEGFTEPEQEKVEATAMKMIALKLIKFGTFWDKRKFVVKIEEADFVPQVLFWRLGVPEKRP